MLPRTIELNNWTSEKKCRKLVENLAKKHFTAVYCATAQEAVHIRPSVVLRAGAPAPTRQIGFPCPT